MKEGDVYLKLAEGWGYPNSSRFLRILETIMTPEEGRLLLGLPAPTPEELAKRLNMDEKSVKTKLHELARRGLRQISHAGCLRLVMRLSPPVATRSNQAPA